jgi:hypothetical protein
LLRQVKALRQSVLSAQLVGQNGPTRLTSHRKGEHFVVLITQAPCEQVPDSAVVAVVGSVATLPESS